jgi:hypothetical protein
MGLFRRKSVGREPPLRKVIGSKGLGPRLGRRKRRDPDLLKRLSGGWGNPGSN